MVKNPVKAKNSVSQNMTKKNPKNRREKNKTDFRVECFVCQSVVSRKDRHILQQLDFLDKKFSLDFYRTKHATKTKSIYDSQTCFRSFGSLETHKFIKNCQSANVIKVENHCSRSSSLMEIRMAVKSKVLPSARELEIAQRFVDCKTDLAKCGGEDRKWSQDRAGIVKLMAQINNLTFVLKKNRGSSEGLFGHDEHN